MYLLPAGTGARSTTKWGLGGFQLRKGLDIAGVIPRRVFARSGLHGPHFKSKWRAAHVSGLGDTMLDTGITVPSIPQGFDPWFYDAQNTQTPQQPGLNPTTQNSVAQAYKNLQQSAITSSDPLDYVSPQAAIAAGVPAQSAYNAWSASIAKFPTQQAALAAGIPAGVVTQLWAQSRSAMPSSAASGSFFSGSTLGVPNSILLLGGGGIALLAMMRRH